jgi:DnaA family protein
MSASAPVQLPLGIGWTDSSSFENFHAGSNAEALAHLTQLHEMPGAKAAYLWGAPGAGKTHLLHALCHAAAQRGEGSAYLPLGRHAEWAPQIVEGFEHCTVVCLDDIDAIAGNAAWEEALFHLFNRVAEHGHAFVAAGRQAPAQLSIKLADLRSRTQCGLVLQLHPLDESQSIAALQLRARRRGFELPDEVANYLLRRCPRDTASLFQLLDRLDAASLAAQRKLTIPFVRDLI